MAPARNSWSGASATSTIAKLEPVGSYAVQIIFSDGHNTGLFTWPYLLKLGREREAIWSAYLDKLQAAGLRR